ncbi:MFS transporter, partial [Actinomadura adrarensis]
GTAAIATLTALWGVLATLTGARTSIAIAGLLLLATPFLLPRRPSRPEPLKTEADPEPVPTQP